jgi:hypothetical protein
MSVLASLTFTVSAGWQHLGRGHDIQAVPLGPEDAPPFGISQTILKQLGHAGAGAGLRSNDLAILKMHAPFNTLTDGQISNKLAAIRGAVLDAMDLIYCENPCLGDSLYHLYDNRRISLAFGGRPGLDSELRDDGSGRFGDEAINLYKFPCPDTNQMTIKPYHPEAFRLLISLAHQGEVYDSKGYSGPIPLTATQLAEYQMDEQCAEYDALRNDIHCMTNVIEVMTAIENNLGVPFSHLGSIAGGIGRSLLNDPSLTTPQKQQKAREMRAFIEGELLPTAKQRLIYSSAYKLAMTFYLGGQLVPLNGYNGALKPYGWEAETRYFDLGNIAYITYLAGGGMFANATNPTFMPDTTLRQIITDITPVKSLVTIDASLLLTSISSAKQLGIHWYVTGDSAVNPNEGALIEVRDTDDDGVFEGNTLRELFRSTALKGGWDLQLSYDKTRLFGLARNGNALHEFTGADAFGSFTGTIQRGTLGTTRDDLRRLSLSTDDRFALGLSYDFSQRISWNTRITWTWDKLDNDSFQARGDYFPFEEQEVSGALSEMLWPGANLVRLTGSVNREAYAYRVDGGGNLTEVAEKKADPHGKVDLVLPAPLVAGERYQFGYGINSSLSPIYTVPQEFNPYLSYSPPKSKGRQIVQAITAPRKQIVFETTQNLVNWTEDDTNRNTGFGSAFAKLDTRLFDYNFVRARVDLVSTVGRADYFTVGANTDCEFHLLANDTFNPGTAVILDTAPALASGLYSLSSQGNFWLHAPTISPSTFSLSYRLVFNGQTSAPVTASFFLAYDKLINPPISTFFFVPAVAVPCLVIGGKNYPLYQFIVGTGPECNLPHYHSLVGLVYSLETPTIGLADPNPMACGFGRIGEVLQAVVPAGLTEWDNFKAAHPPPF